MRKRTHRKNITKIPKLKDLLEARKARIKEKNKNGPKIKKISKKRVEKQKVKEEEK